MNVYNLEIDIKPVPFHPDFRLKKLQSTELQPHYRKHNFYYLQKSITIPLKMFTFAIEIFCELLLLITFIAGTSSTTKLTIKPYHNSNAFSSDKTKDNRPAVD